MKEATGELSSTVITVVAIAAVAAIFTVFVLPLIRAQIRRRTMCASATCSSCTEDMETCNCVYVDPDDPDSTEAVICPNPEHGA